MSRLSAGDARKDKEGKEHMVLSVGQDKSFVRTPEDEEKLIDNQTLMS